MERPLANARVRVRRICRNLNFTQPVLIHAATWTARKQQQFLSTRWQRSTLIFTANFPGLAFAAAAATFTSRTAKTVRHAFRCDSLLINSSPTDHKNVAGKRMKILRFPLLIPSTPMSITAFTKNTLTPATMTAICIRRIAVNTLTF